MFTYEINIAQNYKGRAVHFALVTLPSGTTANEAISIYDEFATRFPASAGYSHTLRRFPVKTYETVAFSEGA